MFVCFLIINSVRLLAAAGNRFSLVHCKYFTLFNNLNVDTTTITVPHLLFQLTMIMCLGDCVTACVRDFIVFILLIPSNSAKILFKSCAK